MIAPMRALIGDFDLAWLSQDELSTTIYSGAATWLLNLPQPWIQRIPQCITKQIPA
jgi:hypothetical protein